MPRITLDELRAIPVPTGASAVPAEEERRFLTPGLAASLAIPASLLFGATPAGMAVAGGAAALAGMGIDVLTGFRPAPRTNEVLLELGLGAGLGAGVGAAAPTVGRMVGRLASRFARPAETVAKVLGEVGEVSANQPERMRLLAGVSRMGREVSGLGREAGTAASRAFGGIAADLAEEQLPLAGRFADAPGFLRALVPDSVAAGRTLAEEAARVGRAPAGHTAFTTLGGRAQPLEALEFAGPLARLGIRRAGEARKPTVLDLERTLAANPGSEIVFRGSGDAIRVGVRTRDGQFRLVRAGKEPAPSFAGPEIDTVSLRIARQPQQAKQFDLALTGSAGHALREAPVPVRAPTPIAPEQLARLAPARTAREPVAVLNGVLDDIDPALRRTARQFRAYREVGPSVPWLDPLRAARTAASGFRALSQEKNTLTAFGPTSTELVRIGEESFAAFNKLKAERSGALNLNGVSDRALREAVEFFDTAPRAADVSTGTIDVGLFRGSEEARKFLQEWDHIFTDDGLYLEGRGFFPRGRRFTRPFPRIGYSPHELADFAASPDDAVRASARALIRTRLGIDDAGIDAAIRDSTLIRRLKNARSANETLEDMIARRGADPSAERFNVEFSRESRLPLPRDLRGALAKNIEDMAELRRQVDFFGRTAAPGGGAPRWVRAEELRAKFEGELQSGVLAQLDEASRARVLARFDEGVEVLTGQFQAPRSPKLDILRLANQVLFMTFAAVPNLAQPQVRHIVAATRFTQDVLKEHPRLARELTEFASEYSHDALDFVARTLGDPDFTSTITPSMAKLSDLGTIARRRIALSRGGIGFRHIEERNARVIAAAAVPLYKQAGELIAKGLRSGDPVKRRQLVEMGRDTLSKLGFAPATIDFLVERGLPYDADTLKRAMVGFDRYINRVDPLDMPRIARTNPVVALALQFTATVTKIGAELSQVVLGELNRGNVQPFARLLLLAPLAGSATLAVSDVMRGSVQALTGNAADPLQRLRVRNPLLRAARGEQPPLDAALEQAISGLLFFGAFGVAEQAFDVVDGVTRRGDFGRLFGPTNVYVRALQDGVRARAASADEGEAAVLSVIDGAHAAALSVLEQSTAGRLVAPDRRFRREAGLLPRAELAPRPTRIR